MKSDIDHFLSKVAKVIKGGNFLYLELNFTNSQTIEFRRGKGTVDTIMIKSILDFCYHIYKYSIEAQDLYKSDLLSIRLFLQNYLMENAKTERLKKLIKKYEEYEK